MGLSSLPAPSEGVLCVLLVNTALSISMVKGLIRSILHIVGIHLPSPSSPSDSVEPTPESFDFRLNTSDSYIEEFRSRTPAIRFDAVYSCKRPEHECSVCLTQFEPESEINCLSCGHLFHKACLEKWLDYWNITCPLCRTPLLPEEEASCICCSGVIRRCTVYDLVRLWYQVRSSSLMNRARTVTCHSSGPTVIRSKCQVNQELNGITFRQNQEPPKFTSLAWRIFSMSYTTMTSKHLSACYRRI
ncbi:hypothetical protein DITRI_Ditri13aG0132600 [Diplodiscus trichospermus]